MSTFEKFGNLLRKWRDFRPIFDHLGLILVDEIHMLNDSERGWVLETILTRLMLMKDITEF